MIDDVENVEEDVEVVGVAQVDVVEVDDAQEEIVVARLIVTESHDVDVRCELPSAE